MLLNHITKNIFGSEDIVLKRIIDCMNKFNLNIVRVTIDNVLINSYSKKC